MNHPSKTALTAEKIYWKKLRSQADRALRHISALEELRKDDEAPQKGRRVAHRRVRKGKKHVASTSLVPFALKYPKSAKSYILEALPNGKWLSLSEIRSVLTDQGFHYSQQALALSVKSLEKRGQIRRMPAPRGSNARHVYGRVKQLLDLEG